MVRLSFHPERISRSTTRAAWREMDRWRRITQKSLARDAERHLDDALRATDELLAFGSTRIELRDRAVDRIVNPPLIVFPAPENF